MVEVECETFPAGTGERYPKGQEATTRKVFFVKFRHPGVRCRLKNIGIETLAMTSTSTSTSATCFSKPQPQPFEGQVEAETLGPTQNEVIMELPFYMRAFLGLADIPQIIQRFLGSRSG